MARPDKDSLFLIQRPAYASKQLGQLRPAGTGNTSIYAPITGIRGTITSIIVCNTSVGAALYRIFHDDDGTTYDQTTALFYDVSLATASSIELGPSIPPGWAVLPGGNFAVRTDTGSALTFTVYGYEEIL